MGRNGSNIWPYVIVGSAVGGAVGYLFMTESGRRIRRTIANPEELARNIARMMEHLGQEDQCRRHLELALSANPDFEQARILQTSLTDPATYRALPHGWDQIHLLAAVVGVRNVEGGAEEGEGGAREVFTTVGNWRQRHDVCFQGEVYHWSKHHEFMKVIDLPARTGRRFELALGRYEEEDRAMLEGHGWRVRRALDFSTDLDAYRRYLLDSRGEFTVAKDQNVRLRSGWFSERSAQYLAAGRPVITQETGFSNVLPTGEGLFGFSTPEEVVEAVDRVNSDYQRHSRGAVRLTREFFSHEVALRQMLRELGV